MTLVSGLLLQNIKHPALWCNNFIAAKYRMHCKKSVIPSYFLSRNDMRLHEFFPNF